MTNARTHLTSAAITIGLLGLIGLFHWLGIDNNDAVALALPVALLLILIIVAGFFAMRAARINVINAANRSGRFEDAIATQKLAASKRRLRADNRKLRKAQRLARIKGRL